MYGLVAQLPRRAKIAVSSRELIRHDDEPNAILFNIRLNALKVWVVRYLREVFYFDHITFLASLRAANRSLPMVSKIVSVAGLDLYGEFQTYDETYRGYVNSDARPPVMLITVTRRCRHLVQVEMHVTG